MLSVSILGIKEKIRKNVKKLDKLNIDYFHIDIMDGKFVENTTWEYKEINKILRHTKTKKDVHLMVNDVKKYVDDFIKLKPEIITFHFEATKEHLEIINYIKENNIKAGLSIKPNTKVEEIKDLLKEVDLVLVMSVEPGKGGQTFIPESEAKIKELRDLFNSYNINAIINVDGGINDKTVSMCRDADMVSAGSYVVLSDNFQEKISSLR